MNQRRDLSVILICCLFLPGLLVAQAPSPAPTFVTGQAAHNVIGQQNFSDITGDTTQNRWGAISGIAIAGNKLIVADSSYLAPPDNSRVLIYNNLQALKNRLPQSDLPPADVVLGEPDFVSALGGTSAQIFADPVGVASDGTRLFISEWLNNRVLIYNRIPTASQAAADVVVGQTSFGTNTFGNTAQQMRRPNSVASDGIRLYVADSLNNRILIYNRIPTTNGAAADVVLGQPGFNTSSALPTAANTLSAPMSVTTDGQRLIVTDLANNRVLIYNSIPTRSGVAADVVVGQPNFTSNSAGNTQTALNYPRYAYSDGTRLFVVDSGNNRILIYNQVPTQNGAAADIVLGQNDFLGLEEACAASNFAIPFAVASDGDMLYVSDAFNRRLLAFRPGSPLIAPSGVVNSASFSVTPQTQACQVPLLQPPLGPGGMASIFGTNLATTTAQADSLPLPTQLGGVSVTFNGYPAPIFYASPTQINVQVPSGLTGYSASMEVTQTDAQGNQSVSAAVPVGLADGAPGLFSLDGSGTGPGVVVHGADFSPVTADSPAAPGEALTVFGTGFGSISQHVDDGAAAVFAAVGGVTIGGTPGTGQQATIVVNGNSYTYTMAATDDLDQVTTGLATMINNSDPLVSATPDVGNEKVDLQARTSGPSGLSITYNAFAPPGGSLALTVDGIVQVPGDITFSGTPAAGEIITVSLASTNYIYSPVATDTLETVLDQLANQMSGDPNVIATVDAANSQLHLTLIDPNSGASIPYSVDIEPSGESLSAITDNPNFTPGVGNVVNTVTATIGQALPVVPGSIAFAGTAEPGQAITVTLQSTPYTYTTVATDTLASVVTNLTNIINADPNVTATADTTNQVINLALKNTGSSTQITFQVVITGGTELFAEPTSTTTTNSEAASVNFAGMVSGAVGLYQVNFTVPTDQTTNPAAMLSVTQNLIVFGSTTATNIVSNFVTFPISTTATPPTRIGIPSSPASKKPRDPAPVRTNSLHSD